MNWGDYQSNFVHEPVKEISSIHRINIHTHLSGVYHMKNNNLAKTNPQKPLLIVALTQTFN